MHGFDFRLQGGAKRELHAAPSLVAYSHSGTGSPFSFKKAGLNILL